MLPFRLVIWLSHRGTLPGFGWLFLVVLVRSACDPFAMIGTSGFGRNYLDVGLSIVRRGSLRSRLLLDSIKRLLPILQPSYENGLSAFGMLPVGLLSMCFFKSLVTILLPVRNLVSISMASFSTRA